MSDRPDPSAPAPAPTWTGKNIVICCDGTGNFYSAPNPRDAKDERNGRNSNIIKLYTAIEVSNRQVAYYHPGVGTMGAPTATNWFTSEWSRVKGLAFGAGFRDNVMDAYRYLMEVYNDNGGNGNEDRVFLFGFSRGAYTARALAGLLHGYGLLCRGNEGHLPYAWRMYVDQHKDRRRNSVAPDESFRLTFSHRTFSIHFVGVFDTVSSVGWVYTPLKLFSVASNPSIVHARHAISIDEHRCFFMDNLYAEKDTPTDIRQAWFAGVHSDVGGSYAQPESGLAYESLNWMLAEAKAHGLRTDPVREQLVMGGGDASDTLHYRPPVSWEEHRSLKGAWVIPEILPHTYYNREFGEEMMRVPLGLRLREVPPGALVHQSVWTRMTNPPPGAQRPYAPRNCPQSQLQPAADLPPAQDGTQYLRFQPVPRPRRHPVLNFLDRYVLTWVFTLFDLLVFVPVLLFVVVGLAGLVLVLLYRAVAFAWHWAPPLWHGLAGWAMAAWHWLLVLGKH